MATITVEVLILGTSSTEWTLPELSQVGVGKTVGVTGSTDAIAQCATAAGAVACTGLGATVARPDEAILFVITEVLCFATP